MKELKELLDDAGHWPSVCVESFRIDIQYPCDDLGVNSSLDANVSAISFASIHPTDDDPIHGNDRDGYPVDALT
jgi:hypothetical protein